MSNHFSTQRGVITQSDDIAGDQSSRNNFNNISTGGSFFPAARNFVISSSQFTEVHGNVCNCSLGVKIFIIIFSKSTIMEQLLLMLYYLLYLL